MTRQETEYLLAELAELTTNLDIPIAREMIIKLRQPTPAFLIGKGKLEEIIGIVQEENIDVLIFDEELSPAQQRNWERESKIAVIDRQEVIIDIFSERAQTKEAVLQVARTYGILASSTYPSLDPLKPTTRWWHWGERTRRNSVGSRQADDQ